MFLKISTSSQIKTENILELTEDFGRKKQKGECEGQRYIPNFKQTQWKLRNHAQIYFLPKSCVHYSQTIEIQLSTITPGKGSDYTALKNLHLFIP